MVRLFQYQPQAQPAPGPAGTMNIQADSSIEKFAAQGMQAAKGWEQQQFEADDLVSSKFNNLFREEKTKKLAALSTLKGEDAIRPSQETGLTPSEQMHQDLVSYQEQLKKDMGGGAQRLFDVKSGAEISHAAETASVHSAKAQEEFKVSTLDDEFTGLANELSISARDPKRVAELHAQLQINRQSRYSGLKADETIKSDISKTVLSTITSMVKSEQEVGPVDGPNKHLFDMMTNPDRLAAIALTAPADVQNAALKAARATYYSGVKLSAVRGMAEGIFGDDSKRVDAYVTRMEHMIGQEKNDRATAGEDNHGTVMADAVRNPGLIPTLHNTTYLNPNIDSEWRGKTMLALKHLEKSNAEDPKLLFPMFAALVTSPDFGNMDRETALMAVSRLGAYAPQALARWEQAQQPGAKVVIPAAVSDGVKKQLQDAGHFNPKNAGQVATFDKALMQTMDYFTEQSKGKGKYATKPPSTLEMYNELQLRITPVVLKTGILWDTKAPLATMNPTELKKAFENLPIERRELIKKSLAARNLPSDGRSIFDLNTSYDKMEKDNPEAYKAAVAKLKLPPPTTPSISAAVAPVAPTETFDLSTASGRTAAASAKLMKAVASPPQVLPPNYVAPVQIKDTRPMTERLRGPQTTVDTSGFDFTKPLEKRK